jgi:hypothetical protein
MATRPLTFQEELQQPTTAEKLALYHSFLASANEQGSEEKVNTLLNTANPVAKKHMESFLASLKAASKNQEETLAQANGQEKDYSSQESLIAKKSRILLELNREISQVLKIQKKEEHGEGINQALKNAFKGVQSDPQLSQDKEFISALQNTAKNLTPASQQVAGLKITAGQDTVFSISKTYDKRKVIYPIGEAELMQILSTHLKEMYKELGVSYDSELIKADACILACGRIPLATQLSAADSIAFVEKTRIMDNDLDKINKSIRSKDVKEEYHNGLKNRALDMASKEFPQIKKLTDNGIELVSFKGTGTEKMDVLRHLIVDLKRAENAPNKKLEQEKVFEKAIFNSDQTGDKKLKTLVEELKTSGQGESDKVKMMVDGYNSCMSSVRINDFDIKVEIALLEKGKRPCCLDENIAEINVNAHHFSIRKSMLDIGDAIIDTKNKERAQSRVKSHQHVVGESKAFGEGISINQN